MSEQFKVGEIAILALPPVNTLQRYNGTECEVVEPLTKRTLPILNVQIKVYTIVCADGKMAYVMPQWLRKKKPPQEDDANKVVSWDECAWKPPVTTPA